MLEFFATTSLGLEELLQAELLQCGATATRVQPAGVTFSGTLETAYRACLWSRIASRILYPLARFEATQISQLYAAAAAVPWEEHMRVDGTLAVEADLVDSPLRHSRYAAQVVKDAIVDRFRRLYDRRPNVERTNPDLRLRLYQRRQQAVLSLDLAGGGLHRRGYRTQAGQAPLKEYLAAGMLLRAGWPDKFDGQPLVDPMCGSGTLVLEAALLAADVAPGLTREHFGFLSWLGHDDALWQRLLAEARQRREAGLARLTVPLLGYDHDPAVIAAARANAVRAGLADRVRFECRELAQLTAPPGPGLLIVNPPYGERLGEVEELRPLYALLGEKLREQFDGWQAAVLTGSEELGKCLGLRAHRLHKLYNGAIPCSLLHIGVEARWFTRAVRLRETPIAELPAGVQAFANRIGKNRRRLGRWARKEGVSCYRLYDADLPEYALAIDLYEDWVQVQEYAPPATVEPRLAQRRLEEAVAVLPRLLDCPADRVVLKVRQRQKGRSQYGKQGDAGREITVYEGGLSFLVNLWDYLDTGLFLDHRPVRARLRQLAAGKRFLNLYGYTGAATVHAAAGGAASTTTVDLSRTYLDWAERNLAANGIHGPRHRLVPADCLSWLRRDRGEYDLIFLDPPTFSNSKRMEGTLDIQRDHVELIRLALARLAPGGLLVFSTNHRRFKLDRTALEGLEITDISRATIPPDFARDPRIHQCWEMRKLIS